MTCITSRDKATEEKRATSVEQQFGKVAPGLVQCTTDVLFRDLWLRPDLAPRTSWAEAKLIGHCSRSRYNDSATFASPRFVVDHNLDVAVQGGEEPHEPFDRETF